MKLLASDYDGTLLRNFQISKKDIAVIRDFRAAGNIFGIVTGRSLRMIEMELVKRSVPYDFIVAINGGYIVNDKHEVIFQTSIPLEVSEQLVAQIKKEVVDIGVIGDGIVGENFIRKKAFDKHIMHRLFYRYFAKERRNPAVVRNFVIHVKEGQDSGLLANRLEALFGAFISCHRNLGTIIDISAAGVNKANGVTVVAEYYGADQVYVIGDSYNDLEMIRKYNGFAIAGANKEVMLASSQQFKNFTELMSFINR